MLIDAHAHVFPALAGTSGYGSVQEHLAVQQTLVSSYWGRMRSSTLDPACRPMPGEDIKFRVGKYGKYYWEKNGQTCWMMRLPPTMIEMEWLPESQIALMDDIGVDVAVLQAGYMEPRFCNSYFAECVRRWPDRFVATVRTDYSIAQSESHRKDELGKLREAVRDEGMRGVFQGYPRSQAPNDRRMDPFWQVVSDLRIPHVFWTGFQPKSDYLASLDQIRDVLVRFPGVVGIIGHLGGNVRPAGDPNHTGTPSELLPLLRLPNVYFEVGYVLAFENRAIWSTGYEYPYPLHTEIVRRVYEVVGPGRLLWGSDMPNIYRTCTYLQSLDTVRLHCDFLSETDRAEVLSGTASKLFHITSDRPSEMSCRSTNS